MSVIDKLPRTMLRGYRLGCYVTWRQARMHQARQFFASGDRDTARKSVSFARMWNRDVVRTLRELRQEGAL